MVGSRISKQHPFITMDLQANEERGSTYRQCREGKDLCLMQKGEGYVGDVEREGHGVGNGLDRGRVGIIDDGVDKYSLVSHA